MSHGMLIKCNFKGKISFKLHILYRDSQVLNGTTGKES